MNMLANCVSTEKVSHKMDYNLKNQPVNKHMLSFSIHGNRGLNKHSNDAKRKGISKCHHIKLQVNVYYFLVPFDMQNMMERLTSTLEAGYT
jgi:hypothetical protein